MLLAILLVAVTLILFIASQAAIYRRRIARAEELSARAACAQAERERFSKTIVVIGDSLAVGVGAMTPAESVAGRIADAFPHARLYNYSKPGRRACDAMGQLEQFSHSHADVVLIQMCANDVAGLHSIKSVEQHMRAVVDRAHGLGAKVILMPGGNFAMSPFFFWPAQHILMWRIQEIRAMLDRLAKETGATFVDLVCEPERDPFLKEPHRFFSEDLIHPTADGYAFYFTQLLEKAALQRHLAP
ncbi:SGNH/GDSL hydrolase family protein [Usitatibacter palustris]|uniref:SGNH hydrolase-type esterase domain-containing protein n=1 Tax=Usitatibacter palustris TaxID=2732487 RepID=A0A6M4H816_9PROT|nr:SGNH/GDSL hydrolase family protein [Usitatibacter palustris]QJR14843.1 hypothetical protein DSM104440_01657 [Usitatibacter palustris]